MAKTRYIRESVYGATDGIITTFAIVAGVVGASLDNVTIIIVGFASFSPAISVTSLFDMEARLFCSKGYSIDKIKVP